MLILPAVTSTNDVALALGDAGEEGGLVIAAETQTRGRGRGSRTWFSAPCAGIWCTILARPRLQPARAYLLTLAVAVAGVRAARRVAGVALQIKWPNDLVVRGAPGERWLKVGGILAEAKSRGSLLDFAVVGVGLNVNLDPGEFPSEIAAIASSLAIEAGRPVDRAALFRAFLDEARDRFTRLEREGAAFLIEEARPLLTLLGRRVSIDCAGDRVTGTARDIDPSGALILERDGVRMPVLAGEATIEEDV